MANLKEPKQVRIEMTEHLAYIEAKLVEAYNALGDIVGEAKEQHFGITAALSEQAQVHAEKALTMVQGMHREYVKVVEREA